MDSRIIELFNNCIASEFILKDEPLKDYTTFKAGGPASLLLKAKSVQELSSIMKIISENKIPYFVIGNGSNLLISDEGFDGVVIKLADEFTGVTVDGTDIKAGAGVILSRVCMLAKDKALAGMEFAYGIPGTVGGAIVMNAGAYGGEMKDVVSFVELMDEEGNIFTCSNSEMDFAYRDSILKHKRLIVLSATFSLKEGNREEIASAMEEILFKRKDKQPLEYPSAGSTFKRPEGYFAGKLIMDAGLAGFRVGGASVSEKHCGFVINDKNGTAKDIDELMNKVTECVKEKFGVTLEPEVIKIGRF